MRNYNPLEELGKLAELRSLFYDKQQKLLSEYMEDNMDTDFHEVVKTVASVSKVQAYKLCHDYLGGTLRTSMAHVNWILNR